MKIIKIILIFSFLSVNYVFSNGFDYKTEIYLKPLEIGETLDWEYDFNTNILSIYKIEDKEKELYDSIDYLDWNNWEVSGDRRKIIYCENWSNYGNDVVPNYYLLDGNTGKTIYLGKLPEGYTSSNFKYLIYKDSSVEPKVKFVLYNFETKENEKEFIWDLKSEKYFSQEENATYILRSNIPEYDFHIFIVSPGHYIFAEGYLSIKQNKMITIADDEGNDRILDLDSISKFEFGK